MGGKDYLLSSRNIYCIGGRTCKWLSPNQISYIFHLLGHLLIRIKCQLAYTGAGVLGCLGVKLSDNTRCDLKSVLFRWSYGWDFKRRYNLAGAFEQVDMHQGKDRQVSSTGHH